MFKAKNEKEFISYGPGDLSPERQPDGRDSAEKAKEMIEMAMREGSCFFEWTHKRADGEMFPAIVLLSRANLEEKVFLQATVWDITEFKKAEEALFQSEERYRLLAENASDVIWTTDINARFTYISPSVTKLRGFSVEEAMAQSIAEALTPSSLEVATQVFAEELALEQEGRGNLTVMRTLELEQICKDGSTVWTEVGSTFIRDDKGKAIGIVGVGRNINERKEAEKTLQRSEEHFRSLIESSSDMIIIMNNEGTISYGSPSTERLLGYNPENEEWINKSIFDFVHSDDVSKAINAFTQGMQNPGIPQCVELRAKHKDGSWVNVEVVGKNLLENSSVQGVIANVRDVTERKKAEDQIKASLVEKELLLKEIHHRVKNNMQIINSLLSLQSKYITDKKALDSFQETRSRVLSMALVHEELYRSGDLSRISVSHYIESIAKHLFETYNTNPELVTLKTSIENVHLGIDMAVPFGLIISELISNALKHAFPDGRKGEITIDLHQDKDLLHLMIRDNGVGMSQEVNLDDPDTFGLMLVSVLEKQLDASVAFERDKGTTAKIDFKVKEQPDRLASPKV
jgi:PAS domain S-box-containing protein